jgi:hypothetical protein
MRNAPPVTRLVLLCHDTPGAAGWVACEAQGLSADATVDRVCCHRLLAPSRRYPRMYDWLIEVELSCDDSERLVDGTRCGELLADLRLMGARPIALLVG